MAVSWEIPPGWYHVRSAHVIPEDRVSPKEASSKAVFTPFVEQMRTWSGNLRLQDEVWVEFTLGSIRAECMLLTDTILSLHGALVAQVNWNYFDRLWTFVEWTVYCLRRGPDRIQLGSDHFVGAAVVEYQRAIRRLNVEKAGVRDARDRDFLLATITRLFKCDTKQVTEGYLKPTDGRLTCAIKIPITDYTAVERYARATAVAVFAHESADTAARMPAAGDEMGWAALASELGLVELEAALKLMKPFNWRELSELKPAEQQEAEFDRLMQTWWTSQVLPVLEVERRLAMR